VKILKASTCRWPPLFRMTAFLAILVLLASGAGCFAGEIRSGLTLQVKPNSIWFEDAARPTRWQQLRKTGNSAAASYEEELRDAWQFINQLTVKILSYEAEKNQVNVKIESDAGRMLGTTWWLDADTLVQ